MSKKELIKIKYTKIKTNIYSYAVIVLMIDQIIKLIVSNHLIELKEVTIIKNFFSLFYVHNTGAAFSILQNQKYLLIIIGLIALVLLDKYITSLKDASKLEQVSYALIIGGIIGNLLDRIFYSSVIDYLLFKFGSYNFPIFNLADSCIVVGVILLIIVYIKESLKGDKNESIRRNKRKN